MRSHRLLLGGGLLILLSLGAAWMASLWLRPPTLPLIDPSNEALAAQYDAPAGICPWRTPDADRKQFFPGSTESREETRVLSSYRQEMTRRLGRTPTAEENALPVHRILRGEETVGFVLTRRLRGESGLIELVLAVDPQGKVVGAKLQRQREPEAVARLLRSEAWVGAFRGKTAQSIWQPGQDFPAVPDAAKVSALALLDGARVALILLDISRRAEPPSRHSSTEPAEFLRRNRPYSTSFAHFEKSC